jgi:hypothetical protein
MNPTKTRGESRMLSKLKQFLLHSGYRVTRVISLLHNGYRVTRVIPLLHSGYRVTRVISYFYYQVVNHERVMKGGL